MHRRPDVIEELDLHYGLEPAGGHADSASYDIGLGQRRVEDAVAAELHLQASGEFEYSTFAFDLLLHQVFFAAAIGHVFTENHDAIIAPHLILQAGSDQVRH